MSISLIGGGYWGKNIARSLFELNLLVSISDQNQDTAKKLGNDYGVNVLSFDEILMSDCKAVAIALPASLHADYARRAIEAGKHVFVEKPLSLSLKGAKAIQAAAHSARKQVMVGHLIRYNAAFIELQKQLAAGAIGSLRHVQANRLAMGRIRNTESVLFDLCPHDLSLILALIGGLPTKILCAGASHMTPNIVDFLTSFMGFENGVSAGMQTSWLSPFKEHRLTVTGTAGSLVFDDTKPWPEKLTLFQDQMRLNGEHFVIDRASPIALPVPEAEPLKDEMRAFIHTCETGKPAPTDIAEAIMVQKVLETMQSHLIDTSAAPSNHQPVRPK